MESNQNFLIKKSYKKIILIVAAVVILIIAAVAIWQVLSSKNNQKQDKNQTQNSQPSDDREEKPAQLGDQVLSESFTNDFLRLSFKYPKSWTVKDENDIILITSPQFKYALIDNSEKEGFFKINIRQSSSPSEGQYLGRGLAIEQSEKIAYSSPAEGQKKDTYLTNFGLDGSNNFAYFVVQGNFELKKDDSLGPKFASEVESYLIAGGFGSVDLESPLQTNIVSVSSFKNEPTFKTAIEIIKSLQLK